MERNVLSFDPSLSWTSGVALGDKFAAGGVADAATEAMIPPDPTAAKSQCSSGRRGRGLFHDQESLIRYAQRTTDKERKLSKAEALPLA
jgi:hypothetical protein